MVRASPDRRAFRGKWVRNKGFRAALAALSLLACGCLVARSNYDVKVRETDALRDALAGLNKEKSALEARNEALGKQLADEKTKGAALAARVAALENDVRRAGDDLASARERYEGTRITREQLITELLEKEKTTGRRMQELGAKVQALDAEGERLRKEAARAEAETAALREKIAATPEAEALVRERDMLRGRVERLGEEKEREARRRAERSADVAKAVAAAAPGASAETVGPALRLHLPEKVLLRTPGKAELSEAGRAVVAEIVKAAREFPGASVIIARGGTPAAEGIRAALTRDGGLVPERVRMSPSGPERNAELFLLLP